MTSTDFVVLHGYDPDNLHGWLYSPRAHHMRGARGYWARDARWREARHAAERRLGNAWRTVDRRDILAESIMGAAR